MMFPAVAALLVTALLPLKAVAEYDPDEFHQCVLEHANDGMGRAAVVAVRQACAHQNGTTASGQKPPPKVAEDSFISQLKRENPELLQADGCNYPLTLNDCIVSAVRDSWYPSRTLTEVREWLYRSQSEHGPMPEKGN